MIKIMLKEFTLPLTAKIDVMGFRIECGLGPRHRIKDGVLRLTDLWKIQIAYTPFTTRKTYQPPETPQFLEYQVTWEDELEWDPQLPGEITVTYRKKPHSVAMHVQQQNRGATTVLVLLLEISLEIDFAAPKPARPPVKIQPAENPADDPSKASPQGGISGTILDSCRLSPVPKAIIEFGRAEAAEPLLKLVSDWHGKYSCSELVPGTFDVRIKHPRYATLIIKDYRITAGEKKRQDFLLRK